jgi:hypothetical protein
MCHRVEIVAPEPNVSVEILRGPDGTEVSHKLRLLLAGAPALKELEVVRLAAHALRASDPLASGRVARSRNAGRYAAAQYGSSSGSRPT